MPAIVHAKINLSALLHNVKIVKHYAPKAKILAMIKANAYGHGIIHAAKTLAPVVDGLGVARLGEAIMLHEQGIHSPLFILDGFFSKEELQKTLRDHFIPVINNMQQIEMLTQTTLTHPTQVWIKLNTGMNRLGFHPNEIFTVQQQLSQCKNVIQPTNFMMHFACAEEKTNLFNKKQSDLFWETIKNYPGEKSLANSAAIIHFPEHHADWVRPGIMLYGCSPIPETTGNDFNLQPVMTLTSELISIISVKKGDFIGYNGTYQCPHDTRIGIVGIGYGDGYPRHVENGTPVLINGKYAPLVGRVSMDMLTVDLQNHPEVKIGDKVTLWGEGLPVEIIAKAANTICYELLCQVNQTPDRVEYEFIGGHL